MQWTETAIKARLDGTITYIDRDTWRPVTKTVPLDYVPRYRPTSGQKQAASLKGHVNKPWTEQEIGRLLEMRAAGYSIRACAAELGRCKKHTGVILKGLGERAAA